MTDTQIKRLTVLQRYATKYEVIVETMDRRKALLGYSTVRSRSRLYTLMRRRGQLLIDVLGIGEKDIITWPKPATMGASCETSSGEQYARIMFSGRTERQAIMEGELSQIGTLDSKLDFRL